MKTFLISVAFLISAGVITFGFMLQLEHDEAKEAIKAGLEECQIRTNPITTKTIWVKDCNQHINAINENNATIEYTISREKEVDSIGECVKILNESKGLINE